MTCRLRLPLFVAASLLLTKDLLAAPLGIHETIEQVLAHHPDIQNAQERLEEAAGNRNKVLSGVLPTVTGSLTGEMKKDAASAVGKLFNGDVYNSYQLGAEVTQPLYHGGALSAGRALYRQDEERRELDLEQAKRDLTLKTLQSFYGLILAQRKYETQIKIEKIEKEMLSSAEARYRVGNEQLLAVQQIRTNVLLIAPQVEAARNAVTLAAAELSNLLSGTSGQTSATDLKVVGTLFPPTWEEVKKTVPAGEHIRVELRQNLKDQEKLQSQRDLGLSQHWPSLDAFFNWGRTATAKSDLFNGNNTAWQMGLRLSVPIFTGLSSFSDRRIYSSQQQQLRIQERKLRDAELLDRVQAEEDLAYGRTLIDASAQALRQADEALKTATRAYRLGTATYLQISDAQSKQAQAELGYEQAQYDSIQKMAAYFAAQGWGLDPLVAALEQNYQRRSGVEGHPQATK